MPPQPSTSTGPGSPVAGDLRIGLVGFSEQSAHSVAAALRAGLAEARLRHLGGVTECVGAFEHGEHLDVVLLGSRLTPAEREAAREALPARRPGVVVLDVDAPAVGGGAVAAAVRAALATGAPRVVDLRLPAAGQLEVLHQPVVDLRSGEVVGMDALLSDPAVPSVGEWLLDAACRDAARWHRAGLRLEVGVTLSLRQVVDAALAGSLRACLERTRLDPSQLVLHVRESVVVERPERAPAVLAEIRATGAGVALDGFGTGHSSLLLLKRLPVTALQVDRSFVAGLGRDSDDEAIVSSIVSLADGVGATCTADGVETAEQHERLRALGCHRARGPLYGDAVPAADVPRTVDVVEARLADAAAPGPAARGRRQLPPVPADVLEHAQAMHRDGASLRTIAAALNQRGSRHPRGQRWHPASVARLLADAASGDRAGR